MRFCNTWASIHRTYHTWIKTSRPFRSSTPYIIFVIAFSAYTDQFLYAAIVPVTPFALQQSQEAGGGHIASPSQIQSWTTILLAVFGAGCFLASPPWAWFTDHATTRRRPFLLGLLVLWAATILLWFAPNFATQVAGRLAQGLSSAVVWTTGFAVLADTVDSGSLGEAAGYVNLAIDGASMMAPVLGGVVFKHCGYNAVFGLILAVLGVDTICRVAMVEPPRQRQEEEKEKEEEEEEEEDSAVIPKGEVSETTSLDLKPSLHIENVNHASGAESHRTKAHLPAMIRLLFSVRFVAALWGVLTLAVVFSGLEAIIPTTVHTRFGWDSEGSGLLFLPLSLPAMAGPVLGKMTDTYGGRWFLAGSFVVLCPALVLLRLVTEDRVDHKVLLCFLLFAVGCCMAIIPQPLFSEVAHRSRELSRQDKEAGRGSRKTRSGGYYGQAYGYYNMAWSLGNTLGPLLCGFTVEASGWKTATLALGVLSGVTALPVVLCCEGWWFDRRREGPTWKHSGNR